MSDATPAEPRTTVAPRTPSFGISSALALDLGSSYLLSLSRVGAMAAVVGILFRHTTAEFVAVFVLARSMLASLNLLFAGVGPATLIELHRASKENETPMLAEAIVDATPADGPVAIEYATPRAEVDVERPPMSLHAHVLTIASGIGVIAGILATVYGSQFATLHQLPRPSKLAAASAVFVSWFAAGLLARACSEPAAAAFQHRGRLWCDNAIGIIGEGIWLWWAIDSIAYRHTSTLIGIAQGYAVSGAFVRGARAALAPGGIYVAAHALNETVARWFRASATLAVGALGDLLYGAASVLIINQFLSRAALADYAPAMQIDAALLLIVSAISAAVLPRASAAAAVGDRATLRRIFVAAYAASVASCVIAAGVVLAFHRPLLVAWLGTLPPGTAAILPLVLIHTVIGGTAGVGRAVLLGMGRFRAYTVSAVAGGVVNVVLALTFVLGFDMGLRGIVLATIIAVTMRCAIWMPWYILSSLAARATPADAASGGNAAQLLRR